MIFSLTFAFLDASSCVRICISYNGQGVQQPTIGCALCDWNSTLATGIINLPWNNGYSNFFFQVNWLQNGTLSVETQPNCGPYGNSPLIATVSRSNLESVQNFSLSWFPVQSMSYSSQNIVVSEVMNNIYEFCDSQGCCLANGGQSCQTGTSSVMSMDQSTITWSNYQYKVISSKLTWNDTYWTTKWAMPGPFGLSITSFSVSISKLSKNCA